MGNAPKNDKEADAILRRIKGGLGDIAVEHYRAERKEGKDVVTAHKNALVMLLGVAMSDDAED